MRLGHGFSTHTVNPKQLVTVKVHHNYFFFANYAHKLTTDMA